MPDLTLLLIPNGLGDAIRSTLADWVALGVAKPHIVVSVHDVHGDQTPGLLVGAEGTRAGNVLGLLAEQGDVRTLRVCALHFSGDGPGDEESVQAFFNGLIQAHRVGASVVPVRLLIHRDPSGSMPLSREGWHNVVLSPEDSVGPWEVKTALPSVPRGADLARHEAAMVAAMAGLFVGQTGAPFDDLHILPGAQCRVARAFVRRLDASEVEGELRDRVLDVSDGYPRPADAMVRTTYVTKVPLATSQMATALWAKHAALFYGHREAIRSIEVPVVSAWAALKMFFSFLWAALKGAPAAWVSDKVYKTKVAVAAKIQSFVFGGGAGMPAVSFDGAVVGVGRGRDRGVRERIRDLRSAAGDLLDGVPDEHQVHLDMSAVWYDFVQGGFTLVDGMTRDEALPAIQIGSEVGIVQRPSDAASSSSDEFTLHSGVVAAQVPSASVASGDLLEAHDLQQHLSELSRDPSLALDASTEKERLELWQTAQAKTYTGQVILKLAQEVRRRLDEIEQLRARIKVILDAAASTSDLVIDAARAARRIRLALVLTVLAILALVGGHLARYLSLAVLVWAGLAFLAGGLFASFTLYFKGQVALWRRLQQIELDVETVKPLTRNLLEAVRDIARLDDAYTLGLCWTQVLGAFLRDPLPRPATVKSAAPPIASPMPLAVAFGTAQSEPMARAAAVAVLRERVFPPGWLSEAWERALVGAVTQLGEQGVALRQDPSLMYAQRAVREDVLLSLWAERVRDEGVASDAAERTWQRCLSELDANRALVDPLLKNVSVGFGAEAKLRPSTTHLAAVTPNSPGSYGSLAPYAFTPAGQNSGAMRVDREWISDSTSGLGLGRLGVLVQISEGCWPYWLGLIEPFYPTPPPVGGFGA